MDNRSVEVGPGGPPARIDVVWIWTITVALTSVSASIAWLVGMAPSTFHDGWESWPVAGAVAAAATLGVLLLCSIGTAQWLELRRHILGAGVWIPVTAGAWRLGLLVFSLVAPPLWHAGQSTTVILAIGLVAGALMAVTMAATSGFALSWMVKVHLQESQQRSLTRPAGAFSPQLGTNGPRQSHQ